MVYFKRITNLKKHLEGKELVLPPWLLNAKGERKPQNISLKTSGHRTGSSNANTFGTASRVLSTGMLRTESQYVSSKHLTLSSQASQKIQCMN
jgi:hypothetical protein